MAKSVVNTRNRSQRTIWVVQQIFKGLAPLASSDQVNKAIQEANAANDSLDNSTIEGVAHYLFRDGFRKFGNKSKGISYNESVSEIAGNSKQDVSNLSNRINKLGHIYNQRRIRLVRTVLAQEFHIIAPRANKSQVLRAIKESNAKYSLNNRAVEGVAHYLFQDGFHDFGNKAAGLTYNDVVSGIIGNNKQETNKLNNSLNKLSQAYYDDNDKTLVSFDEITNKLKPYTSVSNLQQLKISMNGAKYPKSVIDKSLKVLQHLYDTGADFDLEPDVFDTKDKNGKLKHVIRLKAVLSDTHNTVRLLTDNPHYVGSVATSQGMLYPFKSTKIANPYELVDYAVGNIKGTVVQNYADGSKYGSKHSVTANLLIKDSVSHKIDHFGFSSRRSGSKFNTKSGILNSIIKHAGGPQSYVEGRIMAANQIYLTKVLGDSYKGIDDHISHDQDVLTKFMKDNDITDADKALAEKAASGIVANMKNPKVDGTVSFDGHPKAKQLFNEAQKLSDARIGSFDKGFDPNAVINMITGDGGYNPTNTMLVALNALNYDSNKLINEQNDPNSLVQFKDYMIHFDPDNIQYRATSKPKDLEGYFKIRVLQHVQRVLTADLANSHNKDPKIKVAMDKNGILRWQGNRTVSKYGSNQATNQQISGEIGQIFAPNLPKDLLKYAVKHHISNKALLNMGIISTDFHSGKNFNIVPGIKGWFQFRGVDKGLSRMQRLRGRDFQSMLYARINEDLDSQLLRSGSGDLTSPRDDGIINGLYHSELLGKRLPDHWFENSQKSLPTRLAQIETWRGRVSFGKRLGEISQDLNRSDNKKDNPFAKVIGEHPMSELTNDYHGTFDPDLTSGGKNQGLVLYLAKGAHISPATNADGTRRIMPVSKVQLKAMAKAAGVDSKLYTPQAPIAYIPELRFINYMPEDRKTVAKKYALNESSRFDDNARAAYMSFGGDNFEDSVVVSKDFAKNHPVPARDDHNNIMHNSDGSIKMRPLMSGDKLDDFSHNKATISFVIDPDMDPKKAKSRMLSKEVAIFKQNPGLDIVMDAPSPITRGNGSIAREAMEDHSKNVRPVTYNGNKIGESSLINFMNTVMTSDAKTTNYDRYNLSHGKSRKLSGQMVWGLISQKYTDPATGKVHHCGYNILKHEFGINGRSLSDYREYQLTQGIDLDRYAQPHTMHRTYWKDGKMVSTSNPNYHPNEHRQVFVAKPSKEFMAKHPTYKAPKRWHDFLHMLGNKGGTLLLPFNVKLFGSTKGTPIISNEVPIMSAKLRSNHQMTNGKLKINDYNGLYANDQAKNHRGLFINAQQYRSAQDSYNDAKASNDTQKMHKYHKEMVNAKSAAQANVTLLGRKVRDDQLGGPTGKSIFNKSSLIRNKLMGINLGHSSTAVSQNDPRMPLDTIAVSPRVYRTIFGDTKDVKLSSVDNSNRPDYEKLPGNMKVDPRYKNSYVMLHRDPVNHSGSERGFKVVEDPDMGDGFRMNAINDNSFEGDNDGDTYGIINVSSHDPKVQEDLKHMSVPYQLTDNSGGAKDKNGQYHAVPKTYLDVSADVISGAVKAGIAHERKDPNDPYQPKSILSNKLTQIASEKAYKVNDDGKKVVDGPKTIQKRQKDTTHLVHKCMRTNNFGACHLDFSTPKALKSSIYKMVVKQGAKGSVKSMDTFLDHVHGRATMARELVDNATENKITYGDSNETKINRLNTKLNDIAREPKAGLRHSKTMSFVRQAYQGKGNTEIPKDPKVNKKINTTAKVLDYTMDHYKGYPKLMSAFNREGKHHEDIVTFDTLAAKSFHTAAAGALAQQMVSALGNKDMNTAMDLSQPGDQANLQIKHHPEWLQPLQKLLDPMNGEYTNLLNGRYPDNGKIPLRPQDVVPQWERTLGKFGITKNPDEIKSLEKMQTGNTNRVHSIKQVKAQKGALINKAGYTGNSNHPGGEGAIQKAAKYNDYAQKHNLPQESLYSGPYVNIAPSSVRKAIEHPIIQNEYENTREARVKDPSIAKRIKSNPRITKVRQDFKNIDVAQINKHQLESALNKSGKDSNLSKYYQQLSTKRQKAQSVDTQHILKEAADNKKVDPAKLADAQKAHDDYQQAVSAKQNDRQKWAVQYVFKHMDRGEQSVNDVNEIMSANDHDLDVHNPKYYNAHSHTLVINGQKHEFNPTAAHSKSDDEDLEHYYHKLYTLREDVNTTDPKNVRDCMIAHDTNIDEHQQIKDALKETAAHNKALTKTDISQPSSGDIPPTANKAEKNPNDTASNAEKHSEQQALEEQLMANEMHTSDEHAKESSETIEQDDKPAALVSSSVTKSSQSTSVSLSSSAVKPSAKSVNNEIDLSKGIDQNEDTGIRKGGIEADRDEFSNSMNNQSKFNKSLREAMNKSNSQKSDDKQTSNQDSNQKSGVQTPKRPHGLQDSDDGFGL